MPKAGLERGFFVGLRPQKAVRKMTFPLIFLDFLRNSGSAKRRNFPKASGAPRKPLKNKENNAHA